MQQDKTNYTTLMGDFNIKLGFKEDDSEFAMGPFGYGERNNRGKTLLNFLLHYKLFELISSSSVNGLG